MIISVVCIIAAFLIFAKFIYPKIIAKKQIDFSEKAKKFLDFENISYKNSHIVYAEQQRNAGSSAAKYGRQFALGIAGIQDYTDFVKYIIVYNDEHIIFIPVCVSDFSGNIILCEENNETVQNIKISDMSEISIDEETGLCKFAFGDIRKSIIIPDRAAPYTEQTNLKKQFISTYKV